MGGGRVHFSCESAEATGTQETMVWETVPVWSSGTKLMAWEGSELPIAKGNLERFMSQVNMRTLKQWKPEYLSEHSILCSTGLQNDCFSSIKFFLSNSLSLKTFLGAIELAQG